MIRHIGKPVRARRFLALSLLTFGCLATFGSGASSANGFTQTITDIENPDVSAKVLGLEVKASRVLYSDFWYESRWISTESWDHSLAGSVNGSLTDEQLPRITVGRNPTVVSLAGELATDRAEGTERYNDLEYCYGGRDTTKSPRLQVTLDGFYQSGTSSSSGNPEVSLATETPDPWTQSCSPAAIDTSTRVTRIETVASSRQANGAGVWLPEDGGLTTTKDACTPEYCDFTITGHNANSGRGLGGEFTAHADSSFNLRLRLEYPASMPDEPTPAPDTKITKAPRKLIKTKSGRAKVAIAFSSTGPSGTKFKCRLDRGSFAPCSSVFKRNVGPGKHRFAVKSVYRGNADKTPAVHKWKVKKTR